MTCTTHNAAARLLAPIMDKRSTIHAHFSYSKTDNCSLPRRILSMTAGQLPIHPPVVSSTECHPPKSGRNSRATKWRP